MSVNDLGKRVIVALDVDTAAEARAIAAELGDSVGAYKIGLQLFSACGPELVREFTHAGHRIFLDLKFHDIPNTVAMACREAVRMNVWLLNVHAAGGVEMMKAARMAVDEVCASESLPRPLVIAVTVLTSSTRDTLIETGLSTLPDEQVVRLTRLAAESGLDGVVASAHEAALIRNTIQNTDFVIVTPGIRAANATSDDQKRVTTLGEAIAAGSNYAVIGRPITARADRREALQELMAETRIEC